MGTLSKEERRERIKALRLQQNRNKQLPELLMGTSVIVGKDITENDALTLEQINNHQIKLNRSDFDFNYLNISFPREKVRELQEKIIILFSELNQTNYLTLPQGMNTAVLKVNTAFVIDNIEKLIAFNKYRFCIYDLNHQNGLWVKFYRKYWYLEGEAELRPILELRVFGKEWMKRVATAL